MAYCKTNPCALAPQSELMMTLYTNKEVYSGPNTNGVTTTCRSKYGGTWVFSWPVADGPGPEANIVGHLQGTAVEVGDPFRYHFSLGLVFEDERFKGSTLQIQGTSEINGEWTIVGGTGDLTTAMGTVKRKAVNEVNGRVSELRIHAYLFRIPQ